MTIRTRLFLGFAVIVLLAGVQGFLGLRSVSEVGALATRMYDEPLTAISYARSAQTSFAETYLHMMRAVRLSQDFGSASDVGQIEGAFETFSTDLEVAIERLSDPAARDRAAAIQAHAQAWLEKGMMLLVGSKDGTPITEIPTWIILEHEADSVVEELGLLVEEAAAGGYDFRTQAEGLVEQTITINMAMVAVVLVVSAALALLLSTALVARVKLAMKTARRVADGDLDTRIEAKGRDECAQLLAALSEMQESLKQRREADRRETEEKERQKQVAERHRAQLESQIAKFEAVVAETIDPVSQSVAEMRSMADQMARLAKTTNDKTGTASSATSQASENVQAVSAAAEELSSSISEIGARAGSAGEIARNAVARAEQTVASVSGLAEAAHKIGDVVDLIQQIAAQTNLLALNATIEAARAGEAGKGFAVVAGEVKALATQTAQATDEISSQINSVQTLSGEAAKAIEAIGAVIVEISEHVTTIAAAIEEQNASTSEIARNVHEAASGADRVSSSISEVAGDAEESGRMAGDLASLSAVVADRSTALRGSIETFLREIRAA
ncbi:MAG: methyl-accepting chemotaxis protein [Bacteroidota bacterium]